MIMVHYNNIIVILFYVFIQCIDFSSSNIPPSSQVPIVLNYTSDITIRVHEDLKLICPVVIQTGNVQKTKLPFPFEWNVNGVDETQLSLDLRFTLTEDNRILQVSNVRPSDAGVYTCKGVSGYGYKTAEFNVKVIDDKFCPRKLIKNFNRKKKRKKNKNTNSIWNSKFKPCFLMNIPPDNMNLQNGFIKDPSVTIKQIIRSPGESVEFDCSALGNPTPKYLWMKDASSADWITNVTSVRRARLRIDRVKLEYAGHYTCRVSNSVGEITFSYSLIIRKQHSQIPTIMNGLKNVTVKLGSQITLIGNIACNCKPAIQWLREETTPSVESKYVQIPKARATEIGKYYSMIDPEKDSRITINTAIKPNGILMSMLRINSGLIQDSGKYVLYASRDTEAHTYQTVFISVLDPNAASQTEKNGPPRPSRLVLFIAVPIFVVILCSGVVFFCWSRTHRSSTSSGTRVIGLRADTATTSTRLMTTATTNTQITHGGPGSTGGSTSSSSGVQPLNHNIIGPNKRNGTIQGVNTTTGTVSTTLSNGPAPSMLIYPPQPPSEASLPLIPNMSSANPSYITADPNSANSIIISPMNMAHSRSRASNHSAGGSGSSSLVDSLAQSQAAAAAAAAANHRLGYSPDHLQHQYQYQQQPQAQLQQQPISNQYYTTQQHPQQQQQQLPEYYHHSSSPSNTYSY